MSYVYRHTEYSLWTVGYYTPNGEWEPESDHSSKDAAAQRVMALNGGNVAIDLAELIKERDDLRDERDELISQVEGVMWDYGALQAQHARCHEPEPQGKGA
ncbi:hypothetical protein [Nocardia arthritidis]|uniref:Uncharacterized protein n=1 Tax=Nocardia arthritidis TaxID=228602 RepID=A0A6G9YC55_9NOCA|nr:hypothetical protein [Nocardia arthritidis]QIS10744.1 hypothetical protein F5544_14285 [Nocardia arthritidis]